MRTTVRLDDNLLRQTKIHAAETNQTITMVIEEALKSLLARKGKSSDMKPLELPCLGTGGLLTGVNLDNNSSLLDLMEQH